MFTRADLEAASELVHRTVPPTATHNWPLLDEITGVETWVKHQKLRHPTP